MQKIPTLFKRDPENMRHVLPEVTPGCEWVLAGEGVATRKYDGTCIMFDGTDWWARREVKPGKQPPPNYQPISTDENTGKTVGWEPIEQSPFYKFFQEFEIPEGYPTGTYELCGPKINGNPEGYQRHTLMLHRAAKRLTLTLGNMGTSENLGVSPIGMFGAQLAYDHLRTLLVDPEFTGEGIVWHHPDGRMAKLKVRDFT